MYFVGREKETKQIQRALEQGTNVIVSGKYGIGRTSLIKRLAAITEDRWRFVFVDFSQTPGDICRHLFSTLFTKRAAQWRNQYLSYKSIRFRIAHLDLDDKKPHVLVLDNIAKLSAPKLDLVRYLALESRFRFIAIVEAFLPEEEFLRLRARLGATLVITLGHLSVSSACAFFQHVAEAHQLHWTESGIQSLAEATGGYPLGMNEAVVRELARGRRVANPTTRLGGGDP